MTWAKECGGKKPIVIGLSFNLYRLPWGIGKWLERLLNGEDKHHDVERRKKKS